MPLEHTNPERETSIQDAGEAKEQVEKITREDLDGLYKEILENVTPLVIGSREIDREMLAKAPIGWEFVLPADNISVNGQRLPIYDDATYSKAYDMNTIYLKEAGDKPPEQFNRLEEYTGFFSLPYNNYKLVDLKNTEEFQSFMDSVESLVQLENAPNMLEDVLLEHPELRAQQKFASFQYVVYGHASPLSAGEDPYYGGEIMTRDAEGNPLAVEGRILLDNEALAYLRAKAAKDVLLEQGIPESKILMRWAAHNELPSEWNDKTENIVDADIPGVGLYVVGVRYRKFETEEKHVIDVTGNEAEEQGGVSFVGLENDQLKEYITDRKVHSDANLSRSRKISKSDLSDRQE